MASTKWSALENNISKSSAHSSIISNSHETTIMPSRSDLELLVTAGSRYRRIEEDTLSEEDREKLQVRRERNKQAAARCRNRRTELTQKLEEETDSWEAKNSQIESEIALLAKQKEQLEFLLKVHESTCRAFINNGRPSVTARMSPDSTSDLAITKKPTPPSELIVVSSANNEERHNLKVLPFSSVVKSEPVDSCDYPITTPTSLGFQLPIATPTTPMLSFNEGPTGSLAPTPSETREFNFSLDTLGETPSEPAAKLICKRD